MVVRSGFGHPTVPTDGVVLRRLKNEEGSNVAGSVLDSGLPSGRWFYYTLFFRVGTTWYPINRTSQLVPVDYAHRDTLVGLVPPFYLFNEEQNSTDFITRWMEIIGYDLDLTRTLSEGLEHLFDTDSCPDSLLVPLGTQNLGFDKPNELGDIRYRSVIAKSKGITSFRGTYAALDAFVESATKCSVDTTPGANELLLVDDAEFASGTGNWAPAPWNIRNRLALGFYGDSGATSDSLPTRNLVLSVAEGITAPGDLPVRGILKVEPNGDHMIISCGAGQSIVTTGVEDDGTGLTEELQHLDPTYRGITVESGDTYHFSFFMKRDTEVSGDDEVLLGLAEFNRFPATNGFSDAFTGDGFDSFMNAHIISNFDEVDLVEETTTDDGWTRYLGTFTSTTVGDEINDTRHLVPVVWVRRTASWDDPVEEARYFTGFLVTKAQTYESVNSRNPLDYIELGETELSLMEDDPENGQVLGSPTNDAAISVLFSDIITGDTYGPSDATNLDDIFMDAATNVKLTPLVRCPFFETNPLTAEFSTSTYAHLTALTSLDDLLAAPGFQAVSGSQAAEEPSYLVVGCGVDPDFSALTTPSYGSSTYGAPSNYDADSDLTSRDVTVDTGDLFKYWSDNPALMEGFVLSFDAPTKIWNGLVISITRMPEKIYITGEDVDLCTTFSSDRLFSYVSKDDGWLPSIGDLSVRVPVLDWEPPQTAHVWINPQRVNLIANPTFTSESAGVPTFWRSNVDLAQVDGGIERDGTAKCAELDSSSTDNLIIESNLFPVELCSEGWNIEASVSGTGQVRVGLVFWPEDMDEDNCSYLSTSWVPISSSSGTDPSVFRRIRCSFPKVDRVKEVLLRIEFERDPSNDDPCFVDEVMVEPNYSGLPYFDAAGDEAQVGDLSWYGGSTHNSYSLFYGNRKVLLPLLFGYTDILTNNRVPGEAYNWVPEGITLVPHWDDVYAHRVHSWERDVVILPSDYVDKTVVTAL
jgi:hypothetical protein